MQTDIIQIDWFRSGQSRPYADSVYEFDLTFTGGVLGKWTPTQDMVEMLAAAVYNKGSKNEIKHKDDQTREFYQAYFDKVEKLEENKWKIVIVSPFLD